MVLYEVKEDRLGKAGWIIFRLWSLGFIFSKLGGWEESGEWWSLKDFK